jgi:hypothetical protein
VVVAQERERALVALHQDRPHPGGARVEPLVEEVVVVAPPDGEEGAGGFGCGGKP